MCALNEFTVDELHGHLGLLRLTGVEGLVDADGDVGVSQHNQVVDVDLGIGALHLERPGVGLVLHGHQVDVVEHAHASVTGGDDGGRPLAGDASHEVSLLGLYDHGHNISFIGSLWIHNVAHF